MIFRCYGREPARTACMLESNKRPEPRIRYITRLVLLGDRKLWASDGRRQQPPHLRPMLRGLCREVRSNAQVRDEQQDFASIHRNAFQLSEEGV